MASKCNTRKNSIGPNQPPSREIKNSVASSNKYFELSANFISFQHAEGYPPNFPTQNTLDPSYTSSPDSPTKNQDSSFNEEIRGLTPEEPLYNVRNSEVDQLRRCTRAYLKYIGELPIIYQISRSQTSKRRTQPYNEDETLISNIDDIIIDTISEI